MKERFLTLNFIVDLIIVLLIGLGVFLGIKRGFIKTIAKPVKIILTFVIAISFASPLAEALVEPAIKEPVANQIEEYVNKKCGNLNADNIDEKLPTLLKISASISDIDVEKLAAEEGGDSVVKKIADKLISPTVHIISTIITFIILYFVSKLALSLLLSLLNSILDRGAIGVFNRILGGIFSTAFAFIVVWALAAIFTYVINLPSIASSDWASEFDGGFVYRLFNSINPIELLLSF